MRWSKAATMMAISILTLLCFGSLEIWRDAHAELIKGTLIYHFSEFQRFDAELFGIDFSEGNSYSSHLDSSYWEECVRKCGGSQAAFL